MIFCQFGDNYDFNDNYNSIISHSDVDELSKHLNDSFEKLAMLIAMTMTNFPVNGDDNQFLCQWQ